MRSPLQEKIQITVPTVSEQDGLWESFENSRRPQDIEMFKGMDNNEIDKRKFNYTPPGMEIANQCMSVINQMPLVMAGQSDVSMDTNPASFDEGFRRREMRGVDDQYTGEHVDHFYGDAGGFCERNNYLDRI